MLNTRVIEIPYLARQHFMPFHNRAKRWACLVAHRRAGKTVACVNELIRAAVTCPNREPRFAYIAPHYVQAKDIAWSYLKHYSMPIPGVVANEGELHITYPNGGRVRLYGSDNYDRMRGIYLDGVVMDEPADMHPAAWAEVVRPALADREGWAAFIGTPKGRNGFYDIREQARNNPDEWFFLELRASETGILPETELAAARHDMTPEQYQQEFECSFDAAILGAYYGKEMNEIERAGHFCDLSVIDSMPIFTAWDLGIGDSTSIWVFQVVAGEVHVLDHIENHGEGLEWYVKELRARGWDKCAIDFLPQDARVRSLDTGRTRVETLKALKRNPGLVPAHKVEDGINAVRLMLPKTWFHADKCGHGIECLRQYRADYDEKLKVFRDKPRHDFTSHAADSFRYLAVAHRELTPAVKREKPTKIEARPLTVNDLLKQTRHSRTWE